MPRGPRLDAPGLVHHVTARGIEKRRIFVDDRDRREFLRRLDRVARTVGARLLAWALMPNHVHLVVATRQVRLAQTMARLNTSYAQYFNRRHARVGHLFQNRYHSRVVGDEAYLMTLVPYVHLNPLRAGLVPDLAALARCPWTGHRALMGGPCPRFQDVEKALGFFAPEPDAARVEILARMNERGDPLVGLAADTVVLRPSVSDLACTVARRLGVDEKELRGGSRAHRVSAARAVAIHLACDALGTRQSEAARAFGISQPAAQKARAKGAKLIAKATGAGLRREKVKPQERPPSLGVL